MITGINNNIAQFLRNAGIENVRSSQAATAKKQGEASREVKYAEVVDIQSSNTDEPKETQKVEVKESLAKAFFALDDNENVVIRIVDSEGNLIRQIPPEEFLKASEFLKNNNKNLFSVEV